MWLAVPLFFLLCTFAGLFLSFLWGGTQDIQQVFREMQIEMLLGACLCMFGDWVFGALRFHIFIRKGQTRHPVPRQPSRKFSDALCFLYYTVPDRRNGVSLYLHTNRRAAVSIHNIRYHLFPLYHNHAHGLRSGYRMVRSAFFTQRDYLGESLQLFDVRFGIYRVSPTAFQAGFCFSLFSLALRCCTAAIHAASPLCLSVPL